MLRCILLDPVLVAASSELSIQDFLPDVVPVYGAQAQGLVADWKPFPEAMVSQGLAIKAPPIR